MDCWLDTRSLQSRSVRTAVKVGPIGIEEELNRDVNENVTMSFGFNCTVVASSGKNDTSLVSNTFPSVLPSKRY